LARLKGSYTISFGCAFKDVIKLLLGRQSWMSCEHDSWDGIKHRNLVSKAKMPEWENCVGTPHQKGARLKFVKSFLTFGIDLQIKMNHFPTPCVGGTAIVNKRPHALSQKSKTLDLFLVQHLFYFFGSGFFNTFYLFFKRLNLKKK